MKERKDARRAERLVNEGLAIAARDATTARAKFAEARALDPACYPAFLNGAAVEVRAGCFDAALPLARRATELRPDAADAWSALGHALLRTEGPAAAIAAFERLEALEPRSARAASGMAVALTDLRRGEEALVRLRRVLATAPDDAARDEVHLLIGLNELRLGRPAPAAAAFAEARARRPGFPEPSYYLGVARARLGDPAEARRLVEEALAAGLLDAPLDVADWLRAECGRGPYPRDERYLDAEIGAALRFRIEGERKVALAGLGD